MTKEFQETPMYLEVVDVMTKCDGASQFYYQAFFYINENGDTYTPLDILTVSIERNYSGDFADWISCRVRIPYGKYAYRIYPNRNNLRLVLTKTRLKEFSTSVDLDYPPEVEEFTAILIEEGSSIVSMQGTEAKSEEALDLMGFHDFTFQLFDKCVDMVKNVVIGGIKRGITVEDLIRYYITSTTSQFKLPDDKKLLGVDMVSAKNKKKHEQIQINHGLRLVDLPGFIQKLYGVYNASIGSYIQGRHWYIFPLLDTSRFFEVSHTVNLYIIPKNKFPEMERTYRVLGEDVTIITTGEVDFRQDNDHAQMDEGNAVRYADASKFMGKYTMGGGNRSKADRKKNVNEYSMGKLGNGLDYAAVSEEIITSNPFEQNTKMALRQGGIFTSLWENCNPAVIKPGQPCRIVYFHEEEMKETHGIILSMNCVSQKVGGMDTNKHVSNARLQIYARLGK